MLSLSIWKLGSIWRYTWGPKALAERKSARSAARKRLLLGKRGSSMKKFTTVGLGELLWDIFPEGRQLGGAPANFAYMTNLLGDDGIVASRVGNDDLGEEAKHRLEHLGLGTSCIQLDPTYRTGVVQVEVDAKGQPTFQIAEPVAWDAFEWTAAWQALAQKTDAVCFGSLAQRSPQSRQTIFSFLKTIRPETTRVFDVNLRQSFYSAQVLADSAKHADIIKLNHDELPTVVQLLGFPFHDEESAAQWLRHTFHIKLVCITRGAAGSLLVSEYAKHEHPGHSSARSGHGGFGRCVHGGARISLSAARFSCHDE